MHTGLIGLGAMGLPMAQRLRNAGHLTAIWNRTAAKARDFVATATPAVPIAADPAALAAQCRLIITCVSADADLHAVIAALRPGLQAGHIIVDTSTVAADTVRDLAAQLAELDVYLLDAPVSGGVEGARQGSLSMMVGGAEHALAQARPVLDVLAQRIVHMGPSGSGQATKAVNQLMAAGINQAVSEALAFAAALELDLDKVIDVVAGGAAGNWFLAHRGPNMIRDEYPAGFQVALHHKDLEICRAMAETLTSGDNRLPLIEMTLIHYRRLMEAGYGEEDISALYRHKRMLFR